MNRYQPRKGASLSKAQAQALGEALEKIGFHATPQQIIEHARSPKSPIHHMFDWNDTSAAAKYRLAQARTYTNSLEVIVLTDSGERGIKAYHSVRIMSGPDSQRAYCPLETIVESEDLTAQVVSKALSEAQYWQRRYQEYRGFPELSGIFRAITLAHKRLGGKRKKRKTKVA